jgi:hypothetical protein
MSESKIVKDIKEWTAQNTHSIFLPEDINDFVESSVERAAAEFPTLKPLEIAKYLHEVEVWQIKWLGAVQFIVKEGSTTK